MKITSLIIDHDTKYVEEFDQILESKGAEVKRVGPRLPNMNAHIERYHQALRTPCLDHFILFGENHLRHVVPEWLSYYLSERLHQGVGNRVLSEPDECPTILPFPHGQIECWTRLGGLLKHHHQVAA